jgi:ketosteroid isomerase-like protein
MAADGNQETERTLVRHWQAFGAGDVEAILADYAEDAMLIAPDGPVKGHAAIRALFANVFANMFPPKSTSLSLDKQIIVGEIAYIVWSGRSEFYRAAFGTDTFVIRGGKIVVQTFAAQLTKK